MEPAADAALLRWHWRSPLRGCGRRTITSQYLRHPFRTTHALTVRVVRHHHRIIMFILSPYHRTHCYPRCAHRASQRLLSRLGLFVGHACRVTARSISRVMPVSRIAPSARVRFLFMPDVYTARDAQHARTPCRCITTLNCRCKLLQTLLFMTNDAHALARGLSTSSHCISGKPHHHVLSCRRFLRHSSRSSTCLRAIFSFRTSLQTGSIPFATVDNSLL